MSGGMADNTMLIHKSGEKSGKNLPFILSTRVDNPKTYV
jgi:hypothetical protein